MFYVLHIIQAQILNTAYTLNNIHITERKTQNLKMFGFTLSAQWRIQDFTLGGTRSTEGGSENHWTYWRLCYKSFLACLALFVLKLVLKRIARAIKTLSQCRDIMACGTLQNSKTIFIFNNFIFICNNILFILYTIIYVLYFYFIWNAYIYMVKIIFLCGIKTAFVFDKAKNIYVQ